MKHDQGQYRIATIIWKDGTGGAERSLTDLASALDREQFDMRFFYLSGTPGCFAQQIQQLGFKTEFLNWKNGYDFNGRIRLIQSLKRYNPHLIHDHIIPLLTRPFVKAFLRCPILNTEHGATVLYSEYKGKLGWAFLQRFDFLFCDHILANSQTTASALIQLHHFRIDKLTVVHLGINLDNFKTSAKRKQAKCTIGYVGRIENAQKGVDQLPIVAKYLKKSLYENFEFVIVGDGSDKDHTMQLCQEHKVAAYFQFLGFIVDINSLLDTIDLLVVPSRREPFGLVAIEALAKGIPVVAFSVDGLCEIMEECPIGQLVAPGDLEGMANAITTLFRNEEIDHDKGRLFIQKNFSNKKMADNVREIYNRYIH
jgi:glycosyltransferase involved in cell wall biosynthesis